MTPAEWIAWLTPRLLLLFGFGFLVANIKLGASLLAYRRRMRSALLVWPGDKPKYYGFSLALGVIRGLLLMVEAFVLYFVGILLAKLVEKELGLDREKTNVNAPS